MDRWDFDCQKCGRNVGNAYDADSEWWQCSQDKDEYKLLKKVHPSYCIDENGNPISGTLPKPKDLKELTVLTKKYIARNDPNIYGYTATIDYLVNLDTHIVEWHELSKEDEYKKLAGLKEHIVDGRGRGRVGYCFCSKCAKKLQYTCPICGNELVKIDAKDHPGGNGWGIRDGKNKRDPSPMVSMFGE